MISKLQCLGIAAAALAAVTGLGSTAHAAFRPPAVPLVTSDPYLSIWSEADHLNDDVTRHWTHHPNSLVSIIRIDGQSYRLMGNDPTAVPAFPQTGVQVFPTRSIYQFDNGHVHVTMTFMSPALPHDLDALSKPLSYITWKVVSTDGTPHAISIYDSVSSQLAVNTEQEAVQWGRDPAGALTAMKVGTVAQPYLSNPGDDTRIDWGYAYLAAPTAQIKSAIGADATLLTQFVNTGTLPASDDTSAPHAVSVDQPVMALTFDLGNVSATPVSRHVMVAYDEKYEIKYYSKKLLPYWRRNGATAAEMLQESEREYPSLSAKCKAFDAKLMAEMTQVGGHDYAEITALSYRQALAACGLAADANKQPLLFTKENTSNGDIATVDVIFPMEPIFLFVSPNLVKASLEPVFAYAASPHWKFPNAPHDLGTYPQVFGRDDGGEGMPVEESGNMILLVDGLAQAEGSTEYAKRWWPLLTKWEQYLEKYGNDPEDQLCTDDFMGHLAHNTNLSVKAILAIAAYGDLARRMGNIKLADHIQSLAKGYAAHWSEVAEENGHSTLAFDKPNTWSQKYNLVWDKVLGLNVFPKSVAQNEIAYYKTVMQKYGVPLDVRTHLTKTDWSFWSATLADNQTDFKDMIAPIYNYLNNTTARSPLVDSYMTDDIHSDGMHARPVVGGLFIKMLTDRPLWVASAKETSTVGGWAPLPPPIQVQTIIPTSEITPQIWKYMTTTPPDNWYATDFDDSGWKSGPGGFGDWSDIARTKWTDTPGDIYIRRTVTLPNMDMSNASVYAFHDEDIQVYFNGILAAQEGGYSTTYVPLDISPEAKKLLKPGATITIAAHVHQTTGGQGVDIGIANIIQK